MNVGVIGLGSMGMGAALNLVAKGHRTFGCDLREAARTELQQAGGVAVERAAALSDDLAAVLVFVVNAAQAEDVLFGPDGCAPRLLQSAVVICSTTLAPEVARALAARLEERGLVMLDAPVSGGAAGARAGTMTVMASGPAVAFERARPVLD